MVIRFRLKTATRMFYQDLINQENEKALKDVNMQQMIDEKLRMKPKLLNQLIEILEKWIN